MLVDEIQTSEWPSQITQTIYNFFLSDELVYTRKIRKVKKIELVRFLYALNRVATQGKPRGTVKRFEQVHQSKKEKV